eukprot:Phypoly_transcript_19641.p1 GENE.Phypoly_transcript_19641~~Phypoly_transcript_19641.p1  ORF type:complete len:169 (+),score=28.71 Phypoly_transcript_19641:63-569(+)
MIEQQLQQQAKLERKKHIQKVKGKEQQNQTKPSSTSSKKPIRTNSINNFTFYTFTKTISFKTKPSVFLPPKPSNKPKPINYDSDNSNHSNTANSDSDCNHVHNHKDRNHRDRDHRDRDHRDRDHRDRLKRIDHQTITTVPEKETSVPQDLNTIAPQFLFNFSPRLCKV